MLLKDDLNKYLSTIKSNDILKTLNEANIKFLPSYKLQLDKGIYDINMPKKKPSWTDRVLY